MRATVYSLATGLTLLLATSSALAAPRSGVDPASDTDASCAENDSSASNKAREVAELRNRPTATRPAKPSTARATGTTSNRGGGDDVTPVRTQGAKWHSFLPGMFR